MYDAIVEHIDKSNFDVKLGFIGELAIGEKASLVQREVPENAEGNFRRRDCFLTKPTIPHRLRGAPITRTPKAHKYRFGEPRTQRGLWFVPLSPRQIKI